MVPSPNGPISINEVKIDPNNWEDYHDNDENYQKDKSLRGKDSRKREQNQINSAFGKNRAEREQQSQDLHNSKKGKRNDDNSTYGQLQNGDYWDEIILGGTVIIGRLFFVASGGAYVPAF